MVTKHLFLVAVFLLGPRPGPVSRRYHPGAPSQVDPDFLEHARREVFQQ